MLDHTEKWENWKTTRLSHIEPGIFSRALIDVVSDNADLADTDKIEELRDDIGSWFDTRMDALTKGLPSSEMIDFTGDAFAITPTAFMTAGHAWQAWRRGELDADRCVLSAIKEHGAHWIASNLRLDPASLNKVGMLPWDVWGAGWEPGERPTEAQLHLFDTFADLTVDPDVRFGELRSRYETDNSLRMDGTIFSVALGQFENLTPGSWPHAGCASSPP